jgi:capsular exopolysaccharide synthesis family protein
MKALATSVFLGLLAGSALALLLAFGMDRIEAVNDLKALGLNILGSIPPQKDTDSREKLATVGLRDNFSHIVEIFAGINSLVSSNKYIGRTKVLLVNSAMPGEGKTVSACNLAISSALNGSRTLLIDGDLRRPQLANVFNVDEEHPSLLEWLSGGGGKLGYHQLVCKRIIENMDVITSRPLGKVNPAELLGRSQLAELLGWAREHYDRVIIDSPPIGPVGDAQVLANYADSVIMVSRIGKTRRRALKFALARFHEIDAHVLGCIANDVPHSLSGLFGGAEGYGYAYGYGKDYESYGRGEA